MNSVRPWLSASKIKIKTSNKEKYRYLVSHIERNIRLLEAMSFDSPDDFDALDYIMNYELAIGLDCLPPELIKQEWRERLLDCGCDMSPWPQNIDDPHDPEFSMVAIHIPGWEGKNRFEIQFD